MKTAEEWQNELYSSRHGQSEIVTIDEIKAIQLDAYKQACTDMANICRKEGVDNDEQQATEESCEAFYCEQLILSARDNKKEI